MNIATKSFCRASRQNTATCSIGFYQSVLLSINKPDCLYWITLRFTRYSQGP